jgi:YD repeat-containing protein
VEFWTRAERKSGHAVSRCASGLLSVAVLMVLLAPMATSGTTYAYDSLGRVISVRQDDGKQTVYVYDAAGNRRQTIVSGTTLNRVPVAVPDAATLFENQASLTLDPTLNDFDPDGTSLTLFSVADGSVGAATSAGNSLTYTSTRHRNGIDTLTYTITDGQGMSASGRVQVTLANLPPVAVSDTVQSPSGLGRTFDPTINDTDPGNDALKIISVTPPAHGTAQLTYDSSGIMYLPVAGYTGADSLSYVVSDGDGGTAVGAVSIDVVSSAPPPPTATQDAVTLQGAAGSANGASVVFDPRLNDVNPMGQWLRIVAVSQPIGGLVEIIDNGTRLRITSTGTTVAEGNVGPFVYTVQDGIGRQASATISSTINWN